MKPRHAAALALVGWYLLVPSPEMTRVRKLGPLSGWSQFAEFDSAQRCRDELTALREEMIRSDYERWAGQQAKCIASDDPRLAK